MKNDVNKMSTRYIYKRALRACSLSSPAHTQVVTTSVMLMWSLEGCLEHGRSFSFWLEERVAGAISPSSVPAGGGFNSDFICVWQPA